MGSLVGGWKSKTLSSCTIIPDNPLPWFESGVSGLPFAYSRVAVLSLICSKMATNLLVNFEAKILHF